MTCKDYPMLWMTGDTHYRPFWNLDNQIVTHVGFGIAKNLQGRFQVVATLANIPDNYVQPLGPTVNWKEVNADGTRTFAFLASIDSTKWTWDVPNTNEPHLEVVAGTSIHSGPRRLRSGYLRFTSLITPRYISIAFCKKADGTTASFQFIYQDGADHSPHYLGCRVVVGGTNTPYIRWDGPVKTPARPWEVRVSTEDNLNGLGLDLMVVPARVGF